MPEPSVPGADILNLNVFAPAHGTGCPVIVWIHGGGYVAGCAASPWYDGAMFARHGVVLVSVSYRLGLDGFGVLGGVPTNLGLRDLLTALEWVRDNIAAFGGDPERVTVAGQSAGGGAVLALLSSPCGDGLFAAAAVLSGVDLALTKDEGRAATAAVARLLDVSPTAAGLSRASDADAQRATLELRDSGANVLLFGPVLGDDVLPDGILTGLRRRSLSTPVLIGSTADEFDGGPTLEQPDRPPVDRAARAAARADGSRLTDTLFRAVCPRVARARSGGAPTWLYSFEWNSPVTGGATHCIDIPFLFDNLEQPGVPEALGPEPPVALADAVHGDLLRFVHTHRLPWPPAVGLPGEIAREYGPHGQDSPVWVDTPGSYDPALRRAAT
jgi:para-nitrobenzyl esterase